MDRDSPTTGAACMRVRAPVRRHTVVGAMAVAVAVLAAEPSGAQAQAGGTLTLKLARVDHDGGRAFAIAGDTVVVRGTLTPFVPGQRVKVRVYRRGKKLSVETRKVLPDAAGGRFRVALKTAGPGRLTVRATHRKTPNLGTVIARPVHLDVYRANLGPGARGSAVRLLQRRLGGLHYAVPSGGVYDGGTGRAVIAFRKLTGMPRTSVVDRGLWQRLRAGKGAFHVRHPDHGHHVEANLGRQVLALIDGGDVQAIFHMSSGKPSTPTVIGSFHVYSKDPGVNAKGMVASSYFLRGYAVHGYASVPAYPASHGCVRVPIPDAHRIYNWIRYGDIVDVYP